MKSERTIISISNDDKKWLATYSKLYGIPMAEAVRRGIARLRDQEGASTYSEIVEKSKGIWKKGDALKYQQHLRSEWK